MTRSHHHQQSEDRRSVAALHSAGEHGVSFKTCTAEVSSGLNPKKPKPFQHRDPLGLRRPRFSFFISTCQTARVRKTQPLRGKTRSSTRRQSATDNYRLLKHSPRRESLERHGSPPGPGGLGGGAALSGCLIGRALGGVNAIRQQTVAFLQSGCQREINQRFQPLSRTQATILKRSAVGEREKSFTRTEFRVVFLGSFSGDGRFQRSPP